MQEKQLQVIKLSDMTPTVNRRSGIEEKTVNLVATPEVKENSVDLISVSSDDYKAAEEDEISFDEDRLQQWNFVEFRKQLLACVAGIVLCIGCGITSAWAVSDFIKDIQGELVKVFLNIRKAIFIMLFFEKKTTNTIYYTSE